MLLQISKTYTFNTLAPSFLGATIKNAVVASVMDYNTALKYNANLLAQCNNILPLLPVGSSRQFDKYTYYLIKGENNNQVLIAEEWIDRNSINLVQSSTLVVTVVNVDLPDVQRIRNALLLMGYSVTTELK